jgi:hypothetical protein
METEQKFWSSVLKTDTCWLWTRYRDPAGYGQLHLTKKKHILAHRHAWELSHRRKIPKGMMILHHCDNPPCVNPAHLYLGTQMDNMADKMRRGRHRPTRGERDGMAKLNEEQIREIRLAYAAGGVTQEVLAQYFGISQTQISDIIARKRWAHAA